MAETHPETAPLRTHGNGSQPSPFVELSRADWAHLAASLPVPLTEGDLSKLRGLQDPTDIREVDQVYLPISRLLSMYVAATKKLHRATSDFLGERSATTPYVIGIAGSVAVGKSTISRVLQALLSRWQTTPHVELVTTDGFLLPNAELQRRGIMARKGFPESYDRKALLRFISTIKGGADEVRAPYYSHLSYDIVPDTEIVVHKPDVLIVEGLNVLQPQGRHGLAVSDLFDFSIYVDARTRDIANWYEERFLALQRGAFADPKSYFHRYSTLTDTEARQQARQIWNETNLPNLRENIRPTRARATLVLRKDSNHTVSSVLLRKL